MDEQVLKAKELTSEEKKEVIIKRQSELLERASNEIGSLRQHNRMLSAKTETFNKVYELLTMNNRNQYGMAEKAPDLQYEIDKLLSDLKSN